MLLKPKWRLVVASGLQYAAASNGKAAYLTGYGGGPVTLLDEHTGSRRTLSPSNCSIENETFDTWAQPLFFDYPWLLVACGQNQSTGAETYDLYNASSGRWTPFPISSQCQGNCHAVAIGRYWVKLLTDEGTVMYGPSDYYLQNIGTGQFERDPATPGGRIFDDLGALSGAAPLCSPLRYPEVPDTHNPNTFYLGSLAFYGRFAVTLDDAGEYDMPLSYQLRRCGAKLDFVLPTAGESTPGWDAASVPVASDSAVITTADGLTLDGWFLPSLRRFTIRPSLRDYIRPVALAGRTIYVRTGRQLWAATLRVPR